jgi:hypothetical protein
VTIIRFGRCNARLFDVYIYPAHEIPRGAIGFDQALFQVAKECRIATLDTA